MPLYEFVCPGGHVVDEIRAIDRRDELLLCPECGLDMTREFTIPVIHTISTHMMGTGLTDGQGYYDNNLRDRKTGEVPYVHSIGQKRKLLKERGLFEYGPDFDSPGVQARKEAERVSRKVTFAGVRK